MAGIWQHQWVETGIAMRWRKTQGWCLNWQYQWLTLESKIVRNQQCRKVSSAHLLHHDQEWKLHELGCLVKTPDVSNYPDPTLFTSLNSTL